jgi:hypothetical protein
MRLAYRYLSRAARGAAEFYPRSPGDSTMRRRCTVTMALVVFVMTARLTAQPPPPKPGPEHEHFKQHEGIWDATIHSKEGDSKATMTAKVGLGGLWLLEHFKGEFGGMSFEGHGGTSYDPAKKKYINVWIDSMSTSPMISEGDLDKEKQTLTMVGKMPLPEGKSMKVTMITRTTGPDTMTFVMSGSPNGQAMELMKITYKRRAK